MSEKVPSFVIEFAVIVLRVAKQEDGLILSQLVHLLPDKSFYMNISKRYIKALQNAKMSQTELKESL